MFVLSLFSILTEAGFHNRIYQLAGNGGQIGRDDLRTSPNDVPGYLLMSILGGKAGDYMLVRDLLNQPARFLEIYKMNDFNLEPIS